MTNSVKQHSICVKDRTTKTISSGVITIDQFYHVVAAETGTSDDLDTINLDYDSLTFNSITYRPILALIADSGDTITVKHGTGNIDLPDDNDVTLTDDAHIWLLYDGTNWAVFKAVISTTSVVASQVAVDIIGTPTYTTVQDMLLLGLSAGWTSGGGITDNVDGTVDIAVGTGLIRTSDSSTASLRPFDWGASAGVDVSSGDPTYIYVDYNAGSPQIATTTTAATVLDNERSLFELYEVIWDGTATHITTHYHQALDTIRQIQRKMYQIARIERADAEGGLILGETGTRNITVTAGILWIKLNELTVNALDTSGADSFSRFYSDGGGGFTEQTSQTQWDNTHYDDGSGTLATMNNNYYAAQYFYIEADGNLSCMFGQAEYSSLAAAQDDTPPSTVPDRIEEHALLIGRILFKKSDSSATAVQSTFTTTFSASGVSDHGDLAGLSDDDHTQYALLAGRSGGQTLIGGTGSGDDLTLQTTSDGTKGDYILSELTTDGPLIATSSGGVLATEATLAHERGGLEADVSAYGGYPKISGGSTSEVTTIPIADGGTGQTAQTAAFDALSPVTTQGDLIVRDASNNVRLGIGTIGYPLVVNGAGTDPEWAQVDTTGIANDAVTADKLADTAVSPGSYTSADITVDQQGRITAASNGSGGTTSRAKVEDQKTQNTQGGTFTSGALRTRALNTIVSDPDDIISIWYLDYTSGGTYEVVAGDTITGATSGATATVFGVELDSGTWAGGDAAGTIWILDDQSGTFQSENLDVGANSNVATIGADSVNDGNFALLAGTYDFIWSAPGLRVDSHQSQITNITDTSTVGLGTTEKSANAGEYAQTRSWGAARSTIAAIKVFQLQHQCGTTQANVGFGREGNLTTEVYSQLIVEQIA